MLHHNSEENIPVEELQDLSISEEIKKEKTEEQLDSQSDDDDGEIKEPLIEPLPEGSEDPSLDISLTHKHPLQNRWTLWFDSPKKNKSSS